MTQIRDTIVMCLLDGMYLLQCFCVIGYNVVIGERAAHVGIGIWFGGSRRLGRLMMMMMIVRSGAGGRWRLRSTCYMKDIMTFIKVRAADNVGGGRGGGGGWSCEGCHNGAIGKLFQLVHVQ